MLDDAALIAHCRAVLRRGSASFSRAAGLLEPATRDGCCLLYTWGRHCDDVIDGQTLGHGQRPIDAASLALRVSELRSATEHALAGQATDPAFRALTLLTRRHRIDPELPRALLDGMAMDAAGRRYHSLEQLLDYCHHVAGVVAIMAARVMGVENPALLDRMGTLGQAVQLTNIARDIPDDAASGRVYLPLDWLASAGIPPDQIADSTHRTRLATVVAGLLDAAADRYREAEPVIAHLPLRSALAVAVGRALYAEIGAVIRQGGAAAWERRPAVSGRRRTLLTVATVVRTIRSRR